MNNTKALKILNENLQAAIHDCDGLNPEYEKEQVEALQTAVSAVEKQIPQRAIPQTVKTDCISIGRANWRKGTTVYECPNCGTFISPMYDFCYKCGQALDWSDKE